MTGIRQGQEQKPVMGMLAVITKSTFALPRNSVVIGTLASLGPNKPFYSINHMETSATEDYREVEDQMRFKEFI